MEKSEKRAVIKYLDTEVMLPKDIHEDMKLFLMMTALLRIRQLSSSEADHHR